jgi:hypothetical protein
MKRYPAQPRSEHCIVVRPIDDAAFLTSVHTVGVTPVGVIPASSSSRLTSVAKSRLERAASLPQVIAWVCAVPPVVRHAFASSSHDLYKYKARRKRLLLGATVGALCYEAWRENRMTKAYILLWIAVTEGQSATVPLRRILPWTMSLDETFLRAVFFVSARRSVSSSLHFRISSKQPY